MSNKLNIEDIQTYLQSFGYELISKEYVNIRENIIIKDNNNYYYKISLADFKYGVRPKFVHSANPYSIYNIKLYLKNNKDNFKLLSSKYENEDSNLVLCDNEGYYYSLTWRTLKKSKNHAIVGNNNIYSTYNIKLFIKKNKLDLKLLNKFINYKEKLIFIDSNGYIYTRTWNDLKRLNNFHIADKSNPYSIQNIKLWCKLNNKPFELISIKYNNNLEYLKWKCLKDGCEEYFNSSWSNIMSGNGCSYCAGKQVGASNCLATKFPKLASEWHPTLNGNLTPYDITCGSEKYIYWKCKDCGHEWEVTPNNRTSSSTGCPECNKSKGEKECKRVLVSNSFIEISQENYEKLSEIENNNNIYFIPQMKFDRLLGLGGCLLSYDFHIPKLNLIIEYDGEYHYMPIRKYKNEPMKDAEERFKKQQIHDQLKNEYCKKHNITLLRIPYWEFENIESILSKELNIRLNKLNKLQKVS